MLYYDIGLSTFYVFMLFRKRTYFFNLIAHIRQMHTCKYIHAYARAYMYTKCIDM